MADDGLSIVVDPDERFRKFLKKAGDQVSDLTIPYILMTKDWFRSNNAIFALTGPGKYADLAPDSGLSTYDYKSAKKRAVGFVYPILERSGRLKKSLTDPGSSDAVSQIINRNTLILGTQTPYARPLQAGVTRGARIPARPMILLGPEQVSPEGVNRRREAWLKILEDYVRQVMEKE